MTKKFLSVIITITMLLSMVTTIPASAYETLETPILTGHSVWREDGETASIRFMSSEPGTYYYNISDSSTVPSFSELTTGTAIFSDTHVTFSPLGLSAGEKYVHLAVKDTSNNISEVLTVPMLHDYCYFENFEVYPLNTTIASTALNPIVQIHDGTGDENQKVVASIDSSSAKMLALSSTSNNASDQVVYLDKETLSSLGSYVFEGDVYPLGIDGWQLRFSFTNGSYEASNEAGVFFINGKITTATRNSSVVQLKDSYNANQWHHVKIVVTPSVNKYAVYVDNELLNDSLPLPSGIDRLAITAGHGKTAYYDNLEFYANVEEINYVCEIGTQKYTSLSQALSSAVDGNTIKLLADVEYSESINITDKDLLFDLNGNTLDVIDGISVGSGSIDLTGNGELNCYNHVIAYSGGNVKVTNIVGETGTTTIASSTGENSVVTVLGDVESKVTTGYVLRANEYGKIIIQGSVIALGDRFGNPTIDCQNNAEILIGGDLNLNSTYESSSSYGAWVSNGGKIEIAGNATGTNHVMQLLRSDDGGASITVQGDVTGGMWPIIASKNSNIIVHGNVTGPVEFGVFADGIGSNVHVYGNVTAIVGVDVVNGGTSTIDGIIDANTEIRLQGIEIDLSNVTLPTTKAGYLTYSDGTSTVWLEEPFWGNDITSFEDHPFGGGDGSTELQAYVISTANQLAQLAYNTNNEIDYSGKFFTMTSDIDLSGKVWIPIGTSEHLFKGIFNGDHHTIEGLKIGDSSLYNNSLTEIGVFGVIGSEARLRNLFVEGVTIYSSASANSGGLVGHNEGGTIDHCGTSGDIHAYGNLGGLVGTNKGNIINSFSRVNLTSDRCISGGLVGNNDGGNIYNCYTTGDVTGGAYPHAGGLVGYTVNWSGTSIIQNCYATGDVSGSAWGYIGGIFGRSYQGTSFINNYWNEDAEILAIEESGWTPFIQVSADGYLAIPSTEMKSDNFAALLNDRLPDPKASYYEWGIQLNENDDYPVHVQLYTPPLSNNASLSSLIAEDITLSPTFNTETSNYTANVGNNISSAKIIAVAEDSSAAITINGEECTTKDVPLSAGSNTIEIIVTAADDITTKSYTITIEREISNFVCEVDGVRYATLNDGLEATANGGTIKLLADINYNSGLLIENKSIVFDLNGYALNLSTTEDWGHGLEVGTGGVVSIDDTAGGSLNIFGNNSSTNYGVGLYIHDGGSATVTNITSYGWANGADCTGGSLVVKGDVQSGGNGVFAQSGSHVVVEGDIQSGGMGAIASWEETLIEIKGNVYATNGLGLSVSAGTIKVDGNVQSNNFGGVSVSFNGTAEIGGNVTASSSFGAEVKNGGTISIDGVITASQYILLDEILTSADDFILNGNGYYLYTDSENLVMVKAHNCIIDGCSMSIDDGGFTKYTVDDDKIYYHVYTAKQLSHINEHLNLNFIQMNDIDLTGLDWTPIGITYDTPFRGVYNGNGYAITNLNVNQLANTTNKSGGLFGAIVGDAAIKNLDVSGSVTYRVNWYATSSMTGGIAASMFSENGSRPIIDNCSFTGDVTAIAYVTIANNRVSSFAGGIVGYARDGIIKNCSYEGGHILATTIPNTGSTNYAHAGGIAGNLNQNALIINCYTSEDSNISATNSSYNNAGGIAGQLQYNSMISLSYNAGSVNATPLDGGSVEIGGILGQSEGVNTISESYWLDSCGALNQIGNDDSTNTVGKMTDDSIKSMSFCDTLNNALNAVADTTLYTWDQTNGDYPSLSLVLWVTPPPTGGGGSSNRLPAIIVVTDEKNNSIINSTKISSSTISGSATANISTRVVDALLDKISNNGGSSKNDLIEFIVDTKVNTNELKVSILEKDLTEIAHETDAKFGVTSPFISIAFDDKALDAISSADDDGTIVISAGIIEKNQLSEKEQAKVQKRPVYDLTVTNGDKTVSDFNGGYATVTIPYKLQPEEDPDAVVVYYLADDGTLNIVHGHYSEDLKAVVFKTAHFSKFVIGYNYVIFADIYIDAWYKDAVDFIAARSITTGTGNNNFSPDTRLTRAQFVVMLMNAYKISYQDKDEMSQIKNFDDAGNTYYTEYLLVAKSLGIVNGVGNNLFAPEKEITRQEMFVMLYNALKVMDEVHEADSSKQITNFSDSDQVASWAKEATEALINAGIVSGSNNNIYPHQRTTRAEIAQILYNLLSN